MCRSRFTSLVTVLTCAGFVFCGCRPSGTTTANPSMKQVPPQVFFTDPLQVRLAEAVESRDAAGVETAVHAGADVNAWGKYGYSLLYWAMARNNLPGFELLLKNGADVTSDCRDPATLRENRFRASIIRLMLEAADSAYLGAALRQGLSPDYVLDEGSNESLLFFAGGYGNKPALQLLLDYGANIEHQNQFGYTALGQSALQCDFKTMWFLLQRGANPMTGADSRSDVPTQLKTYGSRGVLLEQQEDFEKVVEELIARGLLTRQDIVEADKPKQSVLDGPPGITVIEHSPDSEAGQAILQLDQAERDANARDRGK